MGICDSNGKIYSGRFILGITPKDGMIIYTGLNDDAGIPYGDDDHIKFVVE